MKRIPIFAGLAGLGLAAWLLHSYGIALILRLLAHAGWAGLLAVIGFHLVQVAFSAAAWRAMAPEGARLDLAYYGMLRLIREGVNNLLPVAQIGGEVVAARLQQRHGMTLAVSIATTLADLTVEMITQVFFTLLGLCLLLWTTGGGPILGYSIAGLVAGAAAIGGFVAAQFLGLAGLVERVFLRLGRSFGWAGTSRVEGLHQALIACYRRTGGMAQAVALHMISWLLGGLEVCIALHVLGHDVGISAGLIIESLGQALKSVGFAVPGALGVQEGGYIVVCGLFHLSPEIAIALSLLKRLREVALGLPSLALWQVLESRHMRADRPRVAETLP